MADASEKKTESPLDSSSGETLPRWEEKSDNNDNTTQKSTGDAAQQPSKASTFDRSRKHFGAEVTTDHADLLLLACCLISGFIDSTLYNAFFTFVSMQTGNTIFVGLGASGQNPRPYGWARSLMSIVCFMLGSFCFSRFVTALGPKKRGTLVASFLLQTVFIFVAAGLVEGHAIDGAIPSDTTDIVWNQLAPISLLSFQAAGQIVGSRSLGLGEIPTVVITSLLCDLFSDPAIASPISQNIKRNRRVVAFVLTMVGAIAGGWISKATAGVEAALWVAGGIKGLITIAWLMWSPKAVPAGN